MAAAASLESTEALFDQLRTEVARISAAAFGTKERWAKYTIAGDLVERLARRSIARPVPLELLTQLRSPEYRISATTLGEAAELLEAQAGHVAGRMPSAPRYP